MNTRIRYTETDRAGELASTRSFNAAGVDYQVFLNLNSNTYAVVNMTTGEVAANGTASSTPSLKIAAKKALVALGVVFTNEVRAVKKALENVA